MESVEAMNTLSVQDLKRHGKLQDKVLKWLYNNGYVVASEVSLPNGKHVKNRHTRYSNHQASDRERIVFTINKTLSKKFVYSY